MHATRDRNLLFGILAVQLRKITGQQLVEVAGAWAADPERSLATRMEEAGILCAADRALLEKLVDDAVAAHAGDAGATLSSFGGDEQVYKTFRGAILPKPDGSVVSLCGDAASVADELVPSVPSVREMPGRYTTLGEHGRGGMGRVYRVHDAHLNRDIALKELTLGHGDDAVTPPTRVSTQFANRFLREARITGQLEHPSIVPVYELGRRDDGRLYYTMKFVRGRTLSEAIRDAGSLEARLTLLPHFVDACQAVAYAHSRGILHRDIKPSNIMIGEYGETVLVDWGLAKAKPTPDSPDEQVQQTVLAVDLGGDDEAVVTRYGEAMGTPAYMPPEQARGDANGIDERSDIYSLGAVLYELITSIPPFHGGSVEQIMHQVLEDEPTRIRELERKADPDLVAICDRAMAKEPSGRFGTAKELAEAVQNWRPRRPRRRYLRLAAWATTLLVLGLVVAGTLWVHRTRAHYGGLIKAELATIESNGGMLSFNDFKLRRGGQIQPDSGDKLRISVPGFLVSLHKTYPIEDTSVRELLHTLLASPETVSNEIIQEVVAPYGPLLKLAHDVVRQPTPAPSEVSDVTEMASRGVYGMLAPIRQTFLADLFLLQAFLHIRQGEVDESVAALEDVLLLVQHVRNFPAWWVYESSLRIGDQALESLERIQSLLPPACQQLAPLQQSLSQLLSTDTLRLIIEVERVQAIESYRNQYRQDPFFSVQSVTELGPWMYIWWRRYAYAEIRIQSMYMDAFLKPHSQALEAIRVAEQFRNENYPTWIIPGSRQQLFSAHTASNTRVALAQVAIALNLARTSEYLESLEPLAPRFLTALPSDPYANSSFVYKSLGQSFVLYSLGPNQRDDQGNGDDVCWICP